MPRPGKKLPVSQKLWVKKWVVICLEVVLYFVTCIGVRAGPVGLKEVQVLPIGNKSLERTGNGSSFSATPFAEGEETGGLSDVPQFADQDQDTVMESGLEETGRQFFLGTPSNRGKRRRRPWEWESGGVRNGTDGVKTYSERNVTGSDGGRNGSRIATGTTDTSSSSLIQEQDKLCPAGDCQLYARQGTNAVQSTLPLFKFLLAAFVHAVASVIFFYFWKNIYYPVNDPYATVSPYGFTESPILEPSKGKKKQKNRRRRIGG